MHSILGFSVVYYTKAWLSSLIEFSLLFRHIESRSLIVMCKFKIFKDVKLMKMFSMSMLWRNVHLFSWTLRNQVKTLTTHGGNICTVKIITIVDTQSRETNWEGNEFERSPWNIGKSSTVSGLKIQREKENILDKHYWGERHARALLGLRQKISNSPH